MASILSQSSKLSFNNNNSPIPQTFFNNCLDLYPEFMRPHILEILDYIKKNKMVGKCGKVLIYTNNKGPREWAKSIVTYIERKLNFQLFDKIIGAFKIDGQLVEIDRTSTNKSYKDLITCSKISPNTQICFIDDSYFPNMEHKNIYYIKVEPYIHMLPYTTMVNRFIKSPLLKTLETQLTEKEFENKINNEMYIYGFQASEPTCNREKEKEKFIHTGIAQHIITVLRILQN